MRVEGLGINVVGTTYDAVSLVSGINVGHGSAAGTDGVITVRPLQTFVPAGETLEIADQVVQAATTEDPEIELLLGDLLVQGEVTVPAGGTPFAGELRLDAEMARVTGADPLTIEGSLAGTGESQVPVTVAAGGELNLVNDTMTFPGDGSGETDDGLVNFGTMNLINSTLARLGPVPGWSMGYGFDLDEWVSAEELRSWRDTLHELMGWNHFLGGRPVGPNHGVDHRGNAKWNDGLDYASYEHHRPSYDVYRAAVQATPGKPVMSEDRFRIRKGKYPEKDLPPSEQNVPLPASSDWAIAIGSFQPPP